MSSVLILAAATLLINLPFGYWRESARRFSPAWFVAVHAAVPVIIILRLWLDLEWRLATLPLLLVAYMTGQFLGATLYRRHRTESDGATPTEPSR